MGFYDITGFHGGRQNLSFGLRAGQFRTSARYNFSPGPRVVNNYFGAQNDCCCSTNDSVPGWMKWTMIGGMGMQFLGGLFDIFGGGGGSKTEGAGATEQKDTSTLDSDITKLRQIYDNKKIYSLSDGKIRAQIGDNIETFDNITDLEAALQEAQNAKSTPKSKVNPQLAKLMEDYGIEMTDGGKYKLGDVTYNSLKDAIDAKKTKDRPATTVSADGSVNNNTQSSGVSTPNQTQPFIFKLFENLKDDWSSIDIDSIEDDKTSNINTSTSGDTTCSPEFGTNVHAPKEILVGNRKFVLIDEKPTSLSNGENYLPKYRCTTDKSGKAYSENQIQEYYLALDDGQWKFIQNDSCKGYGKGLGNVIK